MADEKTKKAKVKTPTAVKRNLQSEKSRIRNKAFKSTVSSAVKALESAGSVEVREKLNTVYSLMDKGVKKGIFKPNKANRFKSRITKRVETKHAGA